MLEIVKFLSIDIMKSRWTYAYMILLAAISVGVLFLNGDQSKCIVSLLNLVLVVVPLVSMLFTVVYLHNARAFTELLLCQPVPRRQVFLGSFLGIAAPLCLIFIVSIGLPLACLTGGEVSAAFPVFIGAGLLLTLIFSGVASLMAFAAEDRVNSFALCILFWLYISILHDGIILLLVGNFNDYPVEAPAMVLSLLNPIGMARILILLNLDVGALLGCSGALLNKFFSAGSGAILAWGSLLIWLFLPVYLGMLVFKRKDF